MDKLGEALPPQTSPLRTSCHKKEICMSTYILSEPITLTAQDTLNLIVARYPQALPVLQHFGLDSCCGGALPLHTAAQHHRLDLSEVVAALRVALEGNTQ
jgi:hypothetical protein